MLDNIDPREHRTPPEPRSRETERPAPMSDREVPLTGRGTPAAVHAWLDGELPESAVRQGDTTRDVEFWLRIDREVQVRRQLTTPVHVFEQIMDALPADAPPAVMSWWARPFTITPAVAVAATASALAMGLVIGATVLRAR